MNQLDTLIDIWRSVLQVDEVKPDDNFYDLGGDSLTAVRISELATRAGILVGQEDLMLADSVAELAARVGPVTPPRRPAESARVPLLPSQLRFLHQENRSTERYNGVAWFRPAEDLPVDRLVTALTAVAERHEAFRLVVGDDDDGWHGRVADRPGVPPVIVRELPADTTEETLAQILEETHREVGPAAGALARFVVLDFAAPRRREVLIVVHHLIYDVFSWATITADLERALTGAALTPPTISYRSWAALLAEAASGPLAAERARYWRTRPWDRLAAVPVDLGGERTFASVQVASRRLPAAQTRQLRRSVSGRTARDVFIGTL
jgi:acyl carrier protein